MYEIDWLLSTIDILASWALARLAGGVNDLDLRGFAHFSGCWLGVWKTIERENCPPALDNCPGFIVIIDKFDIPQ